MSYKTKKKDGVRKIGMIILISAIALGLILPSFMSLLWGLGQ